MADDPEFASLKAQFGGSGTTTTSSVGGEDSVFSIPKDWDNVFVLLERPVPFKTQAPGAMGRRVGGAPDDPTGPTVTGGGGRQITLANLLRDYYKTDSRSLAEYQQALWLGGFYSGNDTPVFGVPDERGFAAFKTAAVRAARAKKTLSEVLAEAVGAKAAQPEEAEQRQPLAIRLTNPADIGRVAEAAAREVLGRDPTPDQVQNIVRRYQAAESTYQRSAYDVGYEGGTVTEAPSLETFVVDAFESAEPVEAGAHKVADEVATNFLSLLGGPFGG